MVVDVHSKWPEAHKIWSRLARATISVLTRLFVTFGLPKKVVTYGGPNFVAEVMISYCRMNHTPL